MNKDFLCLFLALLVTCAGCKNKEEAVRRWTPSPPEMFDPCSDEERVELTEKATKEYSFVFTTEVDQVENPLFCKRVRQVMHAIDILPPEVAKEYQLFREKWNKSIYIFRDNHSELGSNYKGSELGFYDSLNYLIALKIDSDDKAVWHEIGHALDFTMISSHSKFNYPISSSYKFLQGHKQLIKREEGLSRNSFECFASSFVHYVEYKTKKTNIDSFSDKSIILFIDNLFSNINNEKLIYSHCRDSLIVNSERQDLIYTISRHKRSPFVDVEIIWPNVLAGTLKDIRVGNGSGSLYNIKSIDGGLSEYNTLKAGGSLTLHLEILDIYQATWFVFSGITSSDRIVSLLVKIPPIKKIVNYDDKVFDVYNNMFD